MNLNEDEMKKEIKTLAKDLGVPDIKFEQDEDLASYSKGCAMTYEQLKERAKTKGVVWIVLHEEGELKSSHACRVEETPSGFFFDDGSVFASDLQIQAGKKDSDFVRQDESGWRKEIFWAFTAEQNAESERIIDKILAERDVLKICATVTHQDILDFCAYFGVTFYQMGQPENWNDKTVFRVSTMQWGFPPRGVDVEVVRVADWKKNPPFIAEGI